MKVGMFVTRKKYNHDIIFRIIDIDGDVCKLRGEFVRLIADAHIDDLEEVSMKEIQVEINDDIRALCGGAGTNRGTGGMITKIHAAEIATQAVIPTVVMNGTAPQDIYKLIDGHSVGTLFTVK